MIEEIDGKLDEARTKKLKLDQIGPQRIKNGRNQT